MAPGKLLRLFFKSKWSVTSPCRRREIVTDWPETLSGFFKVESDLPPLGSVSRGMVTSVVSGVGCGGLPEFSIFEQNVPKAPFLLSLKLIETQAIFIIYLSKIQIHWSHRRVSAEEKTDTGNAGEFDFEMQVSAGIFDQYHFIISRGWCLGRRSLRVLWGGLLSNFFLVGLNPSVADESSMEFVLEIKTEMNLKWFDFFGLT